MALDGSGGAVDICVQLNNRSLIKASDLSIQPYVLLVSNLDLIHDPNPGAGFYIYPKPPSGDLPSIVSTIKSSLPQILNYYFPFAGRIATNSTTGRPEILCNNAGAELIEAQANFPLASLDFHDMATSLSTVTFPYASELALCVQVVGFTCGGFSIAWSSNHLLVDAYSINMFANLWAEIARAKNISRIPNHDRSIFQPRSPPRFGSSLDRILTTCTPDGMINVLAGEVFVKRIYHVTATDLGRLRTLASRDGRRATRVEALSAYVWKTLAKVVGESDKSCQMGWLVNGRRRLGGMQNYVGNLLSFAAGEAGVEELQQVSLSHVAGLVSKAIDESGNEEHFLDLIDWVESHRMNGRLLPRIQLGLGSPAILVSSRINLPVDMDFGFGLPGTVTYYVVGGGARLGAGFMALDPSTRNVGSWNVFVCLWTKMIAALESDPDHVFKPVTADRPGLLRSAAPISRLNCIKKLMG